MTSNYISKDSEFKELSATIRHYGSMRFLIIPIFFVINGGLLVGFQSEKLRAIPHVEVLLAVFSIFLCFVFTVMEFNLNRYIESFVAYGRGLKPDGLWSKRPDPPKVFSVTHCVVTLYWIVGTCWCGLAVSIFIQLSKPVTCL